LATILNFPSKTYVAKSFSLSLSGLTIDLSGTLDGFIDLCITESDNSHRTYVLTPCDATQLATALEGVKLDIHDNCKFDKDSLLEKLDG